MASTTLLTLSGPGIPDYSARGLHQTLRPIDGAIVPRRTVNGALRNIGPPQFQKYRSTISGNDVEPPALDGIWQSANIILSVGCIEELGYLTSAGSPEKPVVSGSTRDGGMGWTFYRPFLSMMVTDFNLDRDEYGAITRWTLDLQET